MCDGETAPWGVEPSHGEIRSCSCHEKHVHPARGKYVGILRHSKLKRLGKDLASDSCIAYMFSRCIVSVHGQQHVASDQVKT